MRRKPYRRSTIYNSKLAWQLILFLAGKAVEQGGKEKHGLLVVCNPTKLIKDHFPTVGKRAEYLVKCLCRHGKLVPARKPVRGSKKNEYMIVNRARKRIPSAYRKY